MGSMKPLCQPLRQAYVDTRTLCMELQLIWPSVQSNLWEWLVGTFQEFSLPPAIESTLCLAKSNSASEAFALPVRSLTKETRPFYRWLSKSGKSPPESLSLLLIVSASIFGSPAIVAALWKSICQGNRSAQVYSPSAHQLLLIIFCWESNDQD